MCVCVCVWGAFLVEVPILEGDILGKFRTKVPKSSMRSSNGGGGGGILGKLQTKIPESSMISSNSRREAFLTYQEWGIL